MQELVSPETSEKLVALIALALLFISAFSGWRAAGKRGLCAGLVGPLVWILWKAHEWVTRYDPQSGYFGLESVAVLLGEIAFFIALGIVLGRVWNGIAKTYQDERDEETAMKSTP